MSNVQSEHPSEHPERRARSHGQETPEVGMLVSVCGTYYRVVVHKDGVWCGSVVYDRHNPNRTSSTVKPIPRPFLFETLACGGCKACRPS